MIGDKVSRSCKVKSFVKRLLARMIGHIVLVCFVLWLLPMIHKYWWTVVRGWWGDRFALGEFFSVHYYAEFFCLITGIVTWGVLGFMMVRYLWVKLIRDRGKPVVRKASSEERQQYESDSSDSNNQEDELCRDKFVAHLSDLLECMEEDSTTYVGLYGEWGSGKSWVLDSLQKYCSKEKRLLDFVEICPWRTSSNGLESQILNAIAAEAHLSEEGFASVIKEYGRSFGISPRKGLLDDIPLVGKWISYRYDCIHDGATLKKRVVKALTGYGRRIVVAIEDMDRLEYWEVRKIIRAIRTNCDIPNVTYILMADEEYLAKAIGYNIGGEEIGRRYLSKIIDFPCQLPSVSSGDLLEAYCARIVAYMEKRWKCGVTGEDRQRLAYLMGLFLTMRDVKRAINSFITEMSRQKVKSQGGVPNVDWVDLAGLSAIKVLESGLYKKLRDTYWTLYNINDIKNATKEFNESWMDNVVLATVNPKRKSTIKLFLKWSMGIDLQHVTSGSDFSGYYYAVDLSRNDLALANHSLMSAYCVDNYFTGKDCTTCVPNVAQSEFLANAISDDVKALETAKSIAEDGKLAYLAQILYEYRRPSNGNAWVTYMASLMRMADENWPEEQLYPDENVRTFSNVDVYGRFVMAIEGKTGDATFFDVDFEKALKRTGAFYIGLSVVSRCWRKGYGYNFIRAGKPQSPNAERIINLILRNSLIATETGKILSHPHKKEMAEEICRLISSTADDELLRMFRSLYERLSGLTQSAPLMIADSCKEVVGGAANGEYFDILDYQRFEATLGEELSDVVIGQLNALSGHEQVGQEVHQVLDDIKRIREKKNAGKPYDRETLMKEFRDDLAVLKQLSGA